MSIIFVFFGYSLLVLFFFILKIMEDERMWRDWRCQGVGRSGRRGNIILDILCERKIYFH